ncbi:MAG: putative aminohydrolase SsnA [Ignavibacteriales bacterium]|nr:putative aminohydrolase SsnA [Ignavibacteriales bacterium]
MLFKNTRSIVLHPSSIESIDLRIQNGKIQERGKNLIPKKGEEVHDLSGRVVMPGLINGHTHLYSVLARGMSGPKEPPQNFLEILQKIWWKLDRVLDEDSIYYSALVGAIDAVRCGTTTLIDHHASPKSIVGSLDVIKETMWEVGLRGVLCYEVTDRGGKKERDKGLEENERFIKDNKKNSQFRGMVGAHAAFTLSNDSLRLCGELAKKHDVGVHIHVAEDKSDVTDAEENYRCSVIDRLKDNGILREDSILAHGVHLSDMELSEVRKIGNWIMHNPRSNMNNKVGYAPVHLFGEHAGLGTDGFPADMFEEAKMGFYKMQDSRRTPHDGTPKLLQNNQELLSQIFGHKFGTLEKGSVADLIILDYQPPTPMTVQNLVGHFLFGMNSSMVESVMIDGKWVVKNRVLVGFDVESVYEKSKKVAKRLWERMYGMNS